MNGNGKEGLNAISSFIYRHFSRDLDGLTRELREFFAEILEQTSSPDRLLGVIAEVVREAGWSAGTGDATEGEIEERVGTTARILTKNGLSGIDPERFYAGVLISTFLVSRFEL